jgi:histone-lysine N-methyltransferase SETMAR
MSTIFVNGTGEYKMAILPERKKNSTYFIECVPRNLTKVCYPWGRGTQEKRIMLHFDNAPVHNNEGVQESLVNFGLRRMAHSPYSPNLAPCRFSLFSAMKQAFAWQHCDMTDDLFMGVEIFLGGVSVYFLKTVFQEWVRQLQLRREGGREDVE